MISGEQGSLPGSEQQHQGQQDVERPGRFAIAVRMYCPLDIACGWLREITGITM
jgi:hypothetical protein